MKRIMFFASIVLVSLLGALLNFACDKSLEGERYTNQPPLVFISSGPLEGDTNTSYKVHFYWNGHDPDGKVDHFQYVITDDEVTGSLIIDEKIYDTLAGIGYEWTNIEVHDSVFIVTADSIPSSGDPADEEYLYNDSDGRFLFRAQHTFFIRAVDEDDSHSVIPAHLTFTATTIAPEVNINHPSDFGGIGDYDNLPPDIFFRWTGNDSVGDGTVISQADSTRYALLNRGELNIDLETTGRMLDFPDSIWSIWRHWDEVDSLNENIGGTKTIVTGLIPFSDYMFFVQAKDEAGAITSHFVDGTNLRKMSIVSSLQPQILVRERSLGVRVSDHTQTFSFTIAEAQPLELQWLGSADHYGSEVTGYRFGWDILDTDNDEEWSSWSLANTATTKEDGFVGGTHSFYVECRDYSGTTTRLIFDFFVVPFTMEEELLFIDDYDNDASDDPFQSWPGGPEASWLTYYHTNEHMKEWWDGILAEYSSYFPNRDFFEVTPTNDKPPFERVANYKRLIWEVKEREPGQSGVAEVARFVDPYVVSSVPYDYLSAFLHRGGQVLMCGVNPVYTMLPVAHEVGLDEYERKGPMSFLRHLGYSQGPPNESSTATRLFLPWRFFGIDTMVKPVDQSPKLYGTNTDQEEFQTYRNFWGMYGARFSGDSFDVFGNSQGWVPGDTLRFSENVYAWLDSAGYAFAAPNKWDDPDCPGETEWDMIECHHEFGIGSVEIYNWDWFAGIFEPALTHRTDQYIPLMSYIPTDDTSRWGTNPAQEHIYITDSGGRYKERKYSTGGGGQHMIGLVGLGNPDKPSVLLGFVPFYFEYDTARAMIDHILIDIFDLPK